MVDPEIQALTQIWLTATVSLIFCHQIAARIPSGAARLLSVLPVIYLFTTLCLRVSSVNLGAPTIFYLVWLGNFKLLLFAFNQGPLSAAPPLPLLRFIAVGLLPIKTKQPPSPNSSTSNHNRPILLLLKCGLLAVIVASYKYREFMQPYLIMALYCCHVYLGLELLLAMTALPVRAVLGLELEPQFDEPYLATSLQDFWGRRWNLMVTSILRPTVYHPVRRISTRILGRRWAPAPAILATFLVSGLMHEVIYYYMSRARPTWEVTWFFVLHGVCLAAEVALKKAVGRRLQLPKVVSRPLTVGFVAVTGGWLFFPQLRHDFQPQFDYRRPLAHGNGVVTVVVVVAAAAPSVHLHVALFTNMSNTIKIYAR
ncbi:Long-chain-alcohol O-fatty-acyltransferase [Sesamum alatum]|uniref:Long-chain-alcohol O-fatty-acyltransferase n=1 Tax=Sesamum alatum TaxID=300844 RepID=A0AAE2CG24_9LAMI|nr:Long-chain-alcohol O-fatty-acyltransferase [Sesamum alatum]